MKRGPRSASDLSMGEVPLICHEHGEVGYRDLDYGDNFFFKSPKKDPDDIYYSYASLLFHVPVEEVTTDMLEEAKRIYHMAPKPIPASSLKDDLIVLSIAAGAIFFILQTFVYFLKGSFLTW